MFFLLDRVTGEKVLSTQCCRRRTGPWASSRPANPFQTRRRSRRSEVRSCHLTMAAQRTGPRRPTARRPASLRQHRRRVCRPLPDHRSGYGSERLRWRSRAGGRRHGAALRAIDALTGKERWVHKCPRVRGLAPRPEAFGGLDDGRGPAVRRRIVRPCDGDGCQHRKDPVALELVQQMSNTPITRAGRRAVSTGRRRRHALCVQHSTLIDAAAARASWCCFWQRLPRGACCATRPLPPGPPRVA